METRGRVLESMEARGSVEDTCKNALKLVETRGGFWALAEARGSQREALEKA